MKEWTIDKHASHKAVLVNTEKRILSFNKDLFWVRISGVQGSELYIYSMTDKKKRVVPQSDHQKDRENKSLGS